MAVRLPVGAVGAAAVPAAAAVAALALAEASWDAVLTSGQQVGGRVEGSLPGLEVVAEVRVWEGPVEAVQEDNSYLRVGDLLNYKDTKPLMSAFLLNLPVNGVCGKF